MSITLTESCASDLMVVNAARVSFAQKSNVLTDADRKLIGFLLKNHHGTPFEHGYFQFHVEAPIFVIRDWFRHRIGHSYNEMSSRYVQLPEKFYKPSLLRAQSGKPGHYHFGPWPISEGRNLGFFTMQRHKWLLWVMERRQRKAWATYHRLLRAGVAKEQAKAVLPVGALSQFYWSCNPRSLMHWLALRGKGTEAIQEIQDLARSVEAEFARKMPETHLAFIKNGRVSP